MSVVQSQVVVVGAGVVGLTCAYLLARDGHPVTVVARDLPGDLGTGWASPFAGAMVGAAKELGQPAILADSLRHWAQISKEGPSTGRTRVCEYYTDDDDSDGSLFAYTKSLFPDTQRIPAEALPPRCRIGFAFHTVVINPDVFLPWIRGRLEQQHGVRFVRAEVASLGEAAARAGGGAVAIVNATALGARVLAGDAAVVGHRGQTLFVPSDYDQTKITHGSEYTYVIPRPGSGGVILGGVSQEGVTDGAVDPATRADILQRVNRLTGNAFAHVDLARDVRRDLVGVRPGRTGGFRLERDDGNSNVVHAYGFKGNGYAFSFGAAERVRELVRDITRRQRARL
ncbi:FAD dependent oxidoreductase [Niveomyces insectorum RCEF 264]|uniref:FAD dependent oxidoreductase n=1 Tax=Niveomyces insectorum RCEF 264 TaxID=1081102 RepID=A0A167ZSX2_9HYPO|nr:FAD dependent oxidoreductase [Niveomyces insectorum RCEF 264]